MTGPTDAVSAPQPLSRDLGPRNDYVPIAKEEIRQSIPAAFEARVAASPDQVVLECGGRRFTYDALNRAANRVAHAVLKRIGDGLEPVALRLGHGDPAIIGILGALKAGKFYVPLDRALPPERARCLIEDAQARLLLAAGPGAADAAEFLPPGCSVCDIAQLDAGLSEENPGIYRAPDDPAVIIYTSGSTGLPKGVIATHCTALRTSRMAVNAYHLGPADREALLSSYAVSMSVANIFGPLLSGAVALPFSIAREGLAALARWLAAERVTLFFTTPTVFRNLAAMLGDAQLPHVRMVALGGETIQPSDVELFRRIRFGPDCLLRITMASTEMCGHAARVFLARNTRLTDGVVPAGWPTEDAEISIVAEDGSEAALGEAGEIVVKSAHLSPGYWRRPELTAKAFAPDPKRPGVRMYRTGDLGRLLPDGCLVHMGRRDHQVKIRGYRVEIAEVEKALLAAGEFSNVAVVAREDAGGDKRLVAYLVANAKPAPAVGQLRARLGEKLPSYMIPSAFVFMDKLPLTAGGKVDRMALPAPAQSGTADAGRVEPKDAVERELARMWRGLLNVPAVGAQDNFFDLGGHSLLAARLFSGIEEIFGVKLPLTTLLQSPTVADLAKVVRGEARAKGFGSMVAFQQSGARRPLFCVAPVDAFEYAQFARRLGADQPFYVFHPAELVAEEIPGISIEALAARYVSELRSVQPKGPYLIGGLCAGGVTAYEMAQQLRAQGESVALLALFDTPFFGRNPRLSRPGYLAARLVHHLGVFWNLKPQQRAGYLKGRWATLLRGRRRRPGPGDVTEGVPVQGIRHAYRFVLREYAPKPYDGPMALFLAAESRTGFFTDNRKKWRRLAVGRVETHVVPGRHHLMLTEPHAGVLAERLRGCLDRAQPGEEANAQ